MAQKRRVLTIIGPVKGCQTENFFLMLVSDWRRCRQKHQMCDAIDKPWISGLNISAWRVIPPRTDAN